jgi:hypothetical protein
MIVMKSTPVSCRTFSANGCRIALGWWACTASTTAGESAMASATDTTSSRVESSVRSTTSR